MLTVRATPCLLVLIILTTYITFREVDAQESAKDEVKSRGGRFGGIRRRGPAPSSSSRSTSRQSERSRLNLRRGGRRSRGGREESVQTKPEIKNEVEVKNEVEETKTVNDVVETSIVNNVVEEVKLASNEVEDAISVEEDVKVVETDSSKDLVIEESAIENGPLPQNPRRRVPMPFRGGNTFSSTGEINDKSTDSDTKACSDMLKTRAGGADKTIVEMLSNVNKPEVLAPLFEDIVFNFIRSKNKSK